MLTNQSSCLIRHTMSVVNFKLSKLKKIAYLVVIGNLSSRLNKKRHHMVRCRNTQNQGLDQTRLINS